MKTFEQISAAIRALLPNFGADADDIVNATSKVLADWFVQFDASVTGPAGIPLTMKGVAEVEAKVIADWREAAARNFEAPPLDLAAAHARFAAAGVGGGGHVWKSVRGEHVCVRCDKDWGLYAGEPCVPPADDVGPAPAKSHAGEPGWGLSAKEVTDAMMRLNGVAPNYHAWERALADRIVCVKCDALAGRVEGDAVEWPSLECSGVRPPCAHCGAAARLGHGKRFCSDACYRCEFSDDDVGDAKCGHPLAGRYYEWKRDKTSPGPSSAERRTGNESGKQEPGPPPSPHFCASCSEIAGRVVAHPGGDLICACGKPAVWAEAAFPGPPRSPRWFCSGCAERECSADLRCTVRCIGLVHEPVSGM